jgi:hypothetical protein
VTQQGLSLPQAYVQNDREQIMVQQVSVGIEGMQAGAAGGKTS